MSATVEKCIITALQSMHEPEMISAVLAARKIVIRDHLDVHRLSFSKPVGVAVLARAQARIEELEAKVATLEAQPRRKPPETLSVTEYVRRFRYSPAQAEAEKARIDRARANGKLDTMTAAKHKAWVTRRTTADG